MRNVAAFLYGQVLLWCVRLIFPAAPAGDFVATHAVWASPRRRQEVTTKRWRAKPPTRASGHRASRHLTTSTAPPPHTLPQEWCNILKS